MKRARTLKSSQTHISAMTEEIFKSALNAFRGYTVTAWLNRTEPQQQLHLKQPGTGIRVVVSIQQPIPTPSTPAPGASLGYVTPPRPPRPRPRRTLFPREGPEIPFNDDDFKPAQDDDDEEDISSALDGNYWQTSSNPKKRKRPVPTPPTTTTVEEIASGSVPRKKLRVIDETEAKCPICLEELHLDSEDGRQSVTYFPCCNNAIHDECLRQLKQFVQGKTNPACILCKAPCNQQLLAAINAIFVDLTTSSSSSGKTKEKRRARYPRDIRNRRVPEDKAKRKRSDRPWQCKRDHAMKNGRSGWKTFSTWDRFLKHLKDEHPEQPQLFSDIVDLDAKKSAICLCGEVFEWGEGAHPDNHPFPHLCGPLHGCGVYMGNPKMGI